MKQLLITIAALVLVGFSVQQQSAIAQQSSVSEPVAEPANPESVDLKKYMGTDTIFQSYKPFHIYGFNKIDNYDWDGKLVTESFKGDDKSWLICFKGEPTINGVTMKTMDYAKLCDKDYKVVLNDAILGIFTKND